jgi:hypothetical protein
MRKTIPPLFFLILVIVIVGVPVHSYAQLWSGVLSTGRAVDWTVVGIPGGIPDAAWTQLGSTIAAGASAATINSALSGCSNQYVLLGAGTFNLTSTINVPANCVLRGSGPNSTTLKFSNVSGSGCGGIGCNIYLGPSSNTFYIGSSQVQPGGSNAATWSGGYSQGASSITVSSVGSAGITNGQVIILDQANDGASNGTAGDTGGVFICDYYNSSSNSCQSGGNGNANGRTINGANHSQTQLVTVTAGCSSACTGAGPFTLTISPGLKATNWRSSQSPGVWWTNRISYAGVENMTVNYSSSTSAPGGIALYDCDNCWVTNVNSQVANRNHVWLYQSSHDVIRNNYFWSTQGHASVSYSVEPFLSSDILIENNIFHYISSPVLTSSCEGCVIGYNFSTNNYYSPSTNWEETSYASHNAGSQMNLWEGNQFEGTAYCDNTWGTSDLVTYFRNQFKGEGYNESSNSSGNLTTTNTHAIVLQQGCRGFNIVGNVLGTAGYSTTYQTTPGSTSGCDTDIYNLGFGETECRTAKNIANDSLVVSSLMRCGNYDTVNGAVRWNSAECEPVAAGSGVTAIAANAIPPTEKLPPSFYLSSQPAWWPSSVPFPAIGPDVTGGTGPGGMAYNIPAANCYTSLGGSSYGAGGPLAFDGGNCYSSNQISPPTNLKAVVH